MSRTTAPVTRTKSTAWACALGLGALAVLGVAGPAGAAAPLAFSMTEHVDNNTGLDTFTSTGAFCPSGTFVDDVVAGGFPHSDHSHSGKGYVLIRSTYTCADGSGTFEELKHLTLYFTDTGFTDAGPMQILGGTGAYAGVTGHGVTTGATDFTTNTGGGTTTGWAQLP